MVLTNAGPVRGCMRSAAIRKSGVVLASASMASAGLSYVSIRPAPMAASIARMTESIDRRLFDDRHGKRGEIAAKSAMVERNPPALSAFPCRPSYWEAGK